MLIKKQSFSLRIAKPIVQGAVFGAALLVSIALGAANGVHVGAMTPHEDSAQNGGTASTAAIASGLPTTGTSIAGSAPGTSTTGSAPSSGSTLGSAPTTTKRASNTPAQGRTATVKTLTANITTTVQHAVATASTQQVVDQTVATTTNNDTTAPQAHPASEATIALAHTTLPHTGPADGLALFAGSTVLGFIGHKLYSRRNRA